MRTMEERLKFDYGLSIGKHLVQITHKGQTKRMLVSISPRGIVRVLVRPQPEDMYSAWRRLKGDNFGDVEHVVVWAASQPEYMAQFDSEPVATIPVQESIETA